MRIRCTWSALATELGVGRQVPSLAYVNLGIKSLLRDAKVNAKITKFIGSKAKFFFPSQAGRHWTKSDTQKSELSYL